MNPLSFFKTGNHLSYTRQQHHHVVMLEFTKVGIRAMNNSNGTFSTIYFTIHYSVSGNVNKATCCRVIKLHDAVMLPQCVLMWIISFSKYVSTPCVHHFTLQQSFVSHISKMLHDAAQCRNVYCSE